MQRVVVFFVGLLSVVRATPFDPVSVDRPTPSGYNFRVEKSDFGNDALLGHEDDYKRGTEENSNFNDESDQGRSMIGLINLFVDVKECEEYGKPPKEGCVYVANGNVHFIHALSAVDIEDVYKALEEAGINECKVGEIGFKDMSEMGCFYIDEDSESLHLMGVFHDNDGDEIIDVKDILDNIAKCEGTGAEIPEEYYVQFDDYGIHLVNVLTEDNINCVTGFLSKLDLKECTFDEDHVITTIDPCYEIDEENKSIHFLNTRTKLVQDDDDDDYYHSEETYTIPDAEVPPQYSV